MGLFDVEKCVFTGLPVRETGSAIDGIDYYLSIGGGNRMIVLPVDALQWEKTSPFFKRNRHIFHSLLLNGQWFEDVSEYITLERLQVLLEQSSYPRTPGQKLDGLFRWLYNFQEEDGQPIQVSRDFIHHSRWRHLFFKSFDEAGFYFRTLEQSGLIKRVGSGPVPHKCWITFAGLEHAVKLERASEKSKNCFVAMSFRPEMIPVREAIRKAIHETGYEAVIVDEQIIDADRTINDEIIASLKRCKFCIADFSNHSKGVYFESGFALGNGKKVIYTCSEDHFHDAHFDIRPLQHIIYENPEKLTTALIHKIRAYID
jgi:nucleoside 2-deoxyribosyltransferase